MPDARFRFWRRNWREGSSPSVRTLRKSLMNRRIYRQLDRPIEGSIIVSLSIILSIKTLRELPHGSQHPAEVVRGNAIRVDLHATVRNREPLPDPYAAPGHVPRAVCPPIGGDVW